MDTGIQLYAPHTSSRRYACFDCRVCFHKSPYAKAHNICPICKKDMLYAGSAFRAPPKRDVKEWAKLEVLIRAGMKFHYCGGNGQIKGMTVNRAKKLRKNIVPQLSPKAEHANDIGRLQYIVRQPGAGKRVFTKAWYGCWGSYPIPD